MIVQPKLVLASRSERRLALLEQVGVKPDLLRPVDINESPHLGELPRVLARRLAREKAEAALKLIHEEGGLGDVVILAADTVVAIGRRPIPKPKLLEEAVDALRLLSGRGHRVFTSVCVVGAGGLMRERTVEARVRFKRLSHDEIENYLASGEWCDKAGGYAIQGLAGAFVVRIIGSYTAIVGLPLYESVNLLLDAGCQVHHNWPMNSGGH